MTGRHQKIFSPEHYFGYLIIKYDNILKGTEYLLFWAFIHQ
jgi:hypothetical protein